MPQTSLNPPSPPVQATDESGPGFSADEKKRADTTDLLSEARGLARDVLATMRAEADIARIGSTRLAMLAGAAVAVTAALLVAAGAALALALYAWGSSAAVAVLLVCVAYAALLAGIGLSMRHYAALLRFPASRSLLTNLGGESQ